MAKLMRVSDGFYELVERFMREIGAETHAEATERLVPIIQRCLRKTDWKPRAIKEIAELLT